MVEKLRTMLFSSNSAAADPSPCAMTLEAPAKQAPVSIAAANTPLVLRKVCLVFVKPFKPTQLLLFFGISPYLRGFSPLFFTRLNRVLLISTGGQRKSSLRPPFQSSACVRRIFGQKNPRFGIRGVPFRLLPEDAQCAILKAQDAAYSIGTGRSIRRTAAGRFLPIPLRFCTYSAFAPYIGNVPIEWRIPP